jgi:hypothetical protein
MNLKFKVANIITSLTLNKKSGTVSRPDSFYDNI